MASAGFGRLPPLAAPKSNASLGCRHGPCTCSGTLTPARLARSCGPCPPVPAAADRACRSRAAVHPRRWCGSPAAFSSSIWPLARRSRNSKRAFMSLNGVLAAALNSRCCAGERLPKFGASLQQRRAQVETRHRAAAQREVQRSRQRGAQAADAGAIAGHVPGERAAAREPRRTRDVGHQAAQVHLVQAALGARARGAARRRIDAHHGLELRAIGLRGDRVDAERRLLEFEKRRRRARLQAAELEQAHAHAALYVDVAQHRQVDRRGLVAPARQPRLGQQGVRVEPRQLGVDTPARAISRSRPARARP